MKIICIGRNYAKHAEELNNPIPDEPVVFLKPDTAILLKKHPFFIPEHSNEVHHEVEVVVKINRLGKHIEPRFAHKYYDEIGLGIDFTARRFTKRKEKGCRGEGQSLRWIRRSQQILQIECPKQSHYGHRFPPYINGFTVQKAIKKCYSVNEIIAHVSKYFTLKTGDSYSQAPQQVLEK